MRSFLHLTTLGDGHLLVRLVIPACANVFDLLHDVEAIDDFAEHYMLPVEERRWYARDEELTSVRIRTRVLRFQSTTHNMNGK